MPPQKEEEEAARPPCDWVTLKLMLAGWPPEHRPRQDATELTVSTSTRVSELQRSLEERYGPFSELVLCLDAAPGQPGHLTILDTRRAAAGGGCRISIPSRTLSDCGVWGRRYHRRAEAERAPDPVVRFLYCSFAPGPDDPLLLYHAGP